MLNVGLRRKRIACLITSTDPEVVQLSKPDYHDPHSPLTQSFIQPKEYEDLFAIRMFIATWSQEFGPIASWPHTLQILYDEVVDNDGDKEWCGDLKEKVRQGLTALNDLKSLFLELPTNNKWMVRDIWCQAFELAGELHRGTASIQAHLAMYGD
jgi:hypothetical protein